ncbi:hypothetical protein ACFL0H_08675 [Thermodesulfobacteriota bacterium]
MCKTIIKLTLIFLFASCLSAYGGDWRIGGSHNVRTGDTELDTTLGDLNVRTQGQNLSDFVSNLSLSYKFPKIEIENLLYKVKMTPADVYMTVGIARIGNRPINEVVNEYKANKGKGWGGIAKNLGIKPGSSDFKALKAGGSKQLDKIKKKDRDKDKNKGKKGKQKAKKKKKK